MPDRASLARLLKQQARLIGFDELGIAPPVLSEIHAERHERWLSHGHHGELGYLERKVSQRYQADSLLPGCRSVIVCALSYYQPSQDFRAAIPPKIARYAQGDDYHAVVRAKLSVLAAWLQQHLPDIRWKACVDSSPLAEKSFAVAAGIGWQGKHGLIINRQYGSWLVLGLLLISEELPVDSPGQDACGSCTACLDSCPAQALIAPRTLDVRRCISYHTTACPAAPDATQLNGWLFGCDACQEACAYNQRPILSRETQFAPKPGLAQLSWDMVGRVNQTEWAKLLENTLLARRRLELMQSAIPEDSTGSIARK